MYDFGGCVEHEISLEEISIVETGKSYPALVGGNKPKYQYCVICEAKGKETVARPVCLQCSTQKRVIFYAKIARAKSMKITTWMRSLLIEIDSLIFLTVSDKSSNTSSFPKRTTLKEQG